MKPEATNNPRAAPREAVVSMPVVVDVFEKYGVKVTLGIISIIAFICLRDFLLQQKIYLFKDIGSDSLNASWPWMAHSSDYILQYGVPSWSFNMGMGQNILSFSFYDPFDYILYLFGRDSMPHLIIYKELGKIVLTGFLFFKYLKLLNLSNYTATVGAMMCAFCGYMVVGSGWLLFSFEVFNAVLLLFCFELLYQKGKWYWFALPVFLFGISRPFNLWLYAIFLALYMVFRLVQSEERVDYRKTAMLLATIIGASILGLGLGAPILLEHVQVIVDSPRASGPDSYRGMLSSAPMFRTVDKRELGTGIMRLFSSDMVGSGIKFRGWQNFLEAPLFYCGLPCLLLFGQGFQFMGSRVRSAACVWLFIWVVPLVFPYFRQALWLFSGDYYRTYSFFIALILMLFAVNAFDRLLEERRISVRALIISGIVLLCLLNWPYFTERETVDGDIRLFAEVSLIVYGCLIYYMVRKKDDLRYKYAFVAWLCVELTCFSWLTVNRRDTVDAKDLSNKSGYNDYSVEAIKYLKQNDTSFYRIDKNYYSSPAMHGGLNDGLAQNYYGTSSYSPFNQKYYINYLKTMGVINRVNELESRWSPGLISRVVLESLNDVKYILTKSGYAEERWRGTHDVVGKVGDVVVLRNRFNLPLGYGFEKYVRLSEFEKLSVVEKDYVSTKACVVDDDDVGRVKSLGEYGVKEEIAVSEFSFDVLRKDIDRLRSSGLVVSEFQPTNIKGGVYVATDQMLYVAIPFDNGWAVRDNGKAADKFVLSNGMTGVLLAKGGHSLDFVYSSLNFRKGLAISGITLFVFVVVLVVGEKGRIKEG